MRLKLMLIFTCFQLSSCLKTYTLLDNITKVPLESSAYKNKSKFDITLLSIVDTSVIYEEYDTYNKRLERLDTINANSFYSGYRFYPNGCFNLFIYNKKHEDQKLDNNPLINGYRGVYYKENNEIKYDLYCIVNQHQTIGKMTGIFNFSGDTLFVRRENTYEKRVFIKRKLPLECIAFEANW